MPSADADAAAKRLAKVKAAKSRSKSKDGETSTHVVILVHGIRDRALWQNSIRDTLEDEGFKVAPSNYDRFSLFKFLLPFPVFRSQAIKEVSKQVTIVKHRNHHADMVIAHSFGTYVISELMKERFEVKFHRIIFCGSVVPYNFEYEQITDRFSEPILNEVGTRDPWPAIAESVTTGYGSAGSYGFKRGGDLVRDRWHNGAGHGFFLNPSFCKDYWVPFLEDGTIVEAAKKPEDPPVWLEALSLFKIKYILVGALLIAGVLAYAVAGK